MTKRSSLHFSMKRKKQQNCFKLNGMFICMCVFFLSKYVTKPRKDRNLFTLICASGHWVILPSRHNWLSHYTHTWANSDLYPRPSPILPVHSVYSYQYIKSCLEWCVHIVSDIEYCSCLRPIVAFILVLKWLLLLWLLLLTHLLVVQYTHILYKHCGLLNLGSACPLEQGVGTFFFCIVMFIYMKQSLASFTCRHNADIPMWEVLRVSFSALAAATEWLTQSRFSVTTMAMSHPTCYHTE